MRSLFLVLFFVPFTLFAEDIELLRTSTAGRKCRAEDVQTLQFGNAISIVFNRFGVDLAQGERRPGYADVETCFVTLELRLPQNRCLEQVDQLFSGGIIKSSRSRGSLLVAYSLGTVSGQALKTWRRNDPILPEDEDSVFSLSFSKRARPHCVRGKVKYHVLMVAEGSRSSINEDFFISHLDSVDSEIMLRLR